MNPAPTVTLHLGDCLDVLRTMEAGSVDAVVTDPPYGVNIASWDKAIPPQSFLVECLRVSRGAVVWFGAASPALHLAFFEFSPIPERIYIWHNTFTRTSSEGAFWQWHPVYVWRKKQFTGLGRDVIAMAANTGGDKHVHPTQKPALLMELLCQSAATQGGTNLDPYMGSGTTGVACVRAGMNFIGIEIDPAYHAIAQRRIADEQAKTALLDAANV
jgi:site-specific DNA-methyltransferase (adenine-specific)